MSKPEDIPQDVWDKAMSFLEASPMVSIPCTSDDRCHLINDPQTAIARAIMTAKAEEREACVQIVFGSYRNHTARCSRIVRAIRKRGEA